jgi:PST family polysaccharide transporter
MSPIVEKLSGSRLNPFAEDGNFMATPQAGVGKLRRLTTRGAGATVFAVGTSLVVQVVATVVLARILTPTDFGVVAMATTFSLLLVNFGFNGFTEAIVQRDQVHQDLASTIFWINTGFGTILTIAFAAAGSLLARFYHDPAVRPVAAGISLTIFVTSISTVHMALLKRAMRFSWLSLNDIVARFFSVGLSVVLALTGWGYWALVVGAIAQPVSAGIGAWILCGWLPGFPKRTAGVGPMLRFALNTYGNFGVNYISRNTDNLLVGWRFDAQSLGFYKKAYDLFALSVTQFVSSIAVVVVAGLSRVNKDPALYRRYLLDAIGIMTFVGMGLGSVLTVTGKDLIFALLGPKWSVAGQIFVFFGPGVGVMVIYATHAWIHLSIGRPDRWLRWAIVEFFATCAMFLLGLRWGPIGVASAWSVSLWVLLIPAIWYAGKPISLRVTSVLALIWRYIVPSVVAVTIVEFGTMYFAPALHVGGVPGALLRIVIATGVVLPLYLGGVILLHGGISPLRRLVDLLKDMSKSGGSKAPSESTAEVLSHSMEAETTIDPVAKNEVPLVSILIPAYNAQEWIADTLRSALAQTWPRKEIIVVDDGSKDNTVAVARRFESQGVLVIGQKNSGASAARNNAYAHCHGDFIQWLDADDLLAPDKIFKQMDVVLAGLSKRTLLSSPWGYFMYRPHRAHFVKTDLWSDMSPYEWLLRKMGKNVFMQTAAWLVSRELTEAAGPWDVRLLGDDDGEYFCRVLLASDTVRFVPQAKVYYRAFRFDGLSYIGRFPDKIEAHWLSMQLHIQYLRSLKDDAATRAACLRYLRDNLIYFYPEKTHIVQQADRLAAELGEPLGAPDLSWKYSWIEKVFGWVVTKPIQQTARRLRWRFARRLDHLLFMIETRMHTVSPTPNPGKSEVDGDLSSLAVKETRPM